MAKKQKSRLKKVKLLMLDIDGVLTDGRILWIEGTGWTSFYSVKDGFGIKRLQNAGVPVALISGGNFASMRKRAEALGIEHMYLGNENKLASFAELQKKLGVKAEDCVFIGDELFDIPLLKEVGFSATVPNAPKSVKKVVDYVTKTDGGFGAVRELIDLILDAKGIDT